MKKGQKGPKRSKTVEATELSRRFLLDVTKDGAVHVRERGSGSCPYGGLPVFSTDTREEAQSLIVRHCKLARDNSGVYHLNEFAGTVEDLSRVTKLFRETARRRNPRRS
jgi:hypothetical protein